jgi:hypothetical protein
MKQVDDNLVTNIVTIANVIELVKAVVGKVGLEFQAPMDTSIEDEKISKAILARVKGGLK